MWYEYMPRRIVTHGRGPISLVDRVCFAHVFALFAPAVASHPLRVNCYFGCSSAPVERSRRLSQRGGYSGNRHERKESERFKSFTYEELLKRDKLNLDIFWLKDESLEDSANLPNPDIIAAEIVEDLQAALAKFAEIATDLKN